MLVRCVIIALAFYVFAYVLDKKSLLFAREKIAVTKAAENTEGSTEETLNPSNSSTNYEFDEASNTDPDNTTVNWDPALKANSSESNNASCMITCLLKEEREIYPPEIVNATRLVSLLQIDTNITNKQTPAPCVAVFFYSPSCPFSCMTAPHFNALHRSFPDIKMTAVDAVAHHSFNPQYGIVGVPSLMLFHNGRPVAKFNESAEYTLEMFAKFLTKCTGLEPKGKLYVTSVDFGGPVSSFLRRERDPYLIMSWSFIALCLLYFIYRSSWWRWVVDSTVSVWREAEAQHHHVD